MQWKVEAESPREQSRGPGCCQYQGRKNLEFKEVKLPVRTNQPFLEKTPEVKASTSYDL